MTVARQHQLSDSPLLHVLFDHHQICTCLSRVSRWCQIDCFTVSVKHNSFSFVLGAPKLVLLVDGNHVLRTDNIQELRNLCISVSAMVMSKEAVSFRQLAACQVFLACMKPEPHSTSRDEKIAALFYRYSEPWSFYRFKQWYHRHLCFSKVPIGDVRWTGSQRILRSVDPLNAIAG